MNSFFRRHLPVAAALAVLAASANAHDFTRGTLTIEHPWSRATSPRAEVGAGFLTIRNTGREADRLLSASSPRAGRVEIHTMRMEDGVMRMRPLPDGIAIPAGARVVLAPGGNHLMLIGLRKPLKEGELVPATLRFARAGAVKIAFKVQGPGAGAPGHMGHGQ